MLLQQEEKREKIAALRRKFKEQHRKILTTLLAKKKDEEKKVFVDLFLLSFFYGFIDCGCRLNNIGGRRLVIGAYEEREIQDETAKNT